ncbi:MAG TPA: Gldg family protein [Candidatus Krumholzibacteria bacterium]|nr:Gldg family protein [Candidatus Krumholzibacteria bacterium]
MQGKRGSVFGVATAVLLVAILVVTNVVSSNFFGRIDLTEGNIFSLDAASKRIVGQLDDTFLVKAYFSKNLPAPYNANAKYVQDKLEEYRAYGKGRFRFEFVDPGSDAKLEEEAQKHRIPPVQVQVVEHDQFAAKRAYMGLVFLYQDRQETIPVVENPVGLEYEITTTIKKLTNPTGQLPVVGFLGGHQEPGLQQLNTVQQVFQKQYQLRPVELAGGQRVAADVQVLLVASPRSPFSPWEKYAIDQFIMRGGKVAFLIDKVDADLQTQRAMPVRLDLDDWLAAYGVRVNDNLVGDMQNPGLLTITQQEGMFRMMSQVPYPFIPNLRDFNRGNVMVKDLERVGVYYASSIDTSVARAHGLRCEPLIFSSPKSGVQEQAYNINPTTRWRPEDFSRGQQVLAAAVYGPFTSYFKDKPVPADSGAAPALNEPTLPTSPENRIVVVGDGEFFVDDKGGNDRDNLLFFQNLVDWLVQDEDLIGIRSREVTDRPLKSVSEATKRVVKYANMLGSPVLVIVLGIAVWQLRRRRRVEV